MSLAITFPSDGGVDTDGRLAVAGPPGHFLHTGFKATMEFYASQAKPGLFSGYGFGTSADLHWNRANGTVDAPTYPVSGDRLMVLAGRCYDESTSDFHLSSAAIIATLTGNASSHQGGYTPSKFTIEQVKASGTTREVVATFKNGNLDLGCFDSGYRLCVQGEGSQITYAILNSAGDTMFYSATADTSVSGGENQSSRGVMQVRANSANGRSINCAGSVNSNGADLAENEKLSDTCNPVIPGQVVGFDTSGRLTDVWRDAVSFGVVSTDPAFIGNDIWGDDPLAAPIAYCGKVPVNVWGAKPGQYIVPVQREGGGIKGIAVRFKLWRKPLGQVRRILADGRAEIAVGV